MKRVFTTLVLFTFAAAAHAQYDRTGVSYATGSDANTCKVSDPCATIAHAITKTNAGGVLTVLDSGTFDGFTIDRAMTVAAAPGAVVTVGKEPGTTNWCVKVDASGARVSIRGLTLIAPAINGIGVQDAAATYVDDVVVDGLHCDSGCGTGIFGGKGDLFVNGARIRNVAQGIDHNPVDDAEAVVTSSVIENALLVGVHAENDSTMTVRDTLVSHAGSAFSAGGITPKLIAVMTLQNCTATFSDNGVYSGDAGIVRMERTNVTNNAVGVRRVGSGVVYVFGNNVVHGNGTNVIGGVTTAPMM